MINFIMFSTSTCAHCKPMVQTLLALENKYDDVSVTIHVVDQSPISRETASDWGIRAVPTTIVIHKGEEIGQLEGNIPLHRMEDLIERALQREILPESSGGSDDSCRPVLCDSSEQKDDGAPSA